MDVETFLSNYQNITTAHSHPEVYKSKKTVMHRRFV
jgi:hypothetical protein